MSLKSRVLASAVTALVLIPSIALGAPPSDPNIVVGVAATNSVPNLKIEVTTSSSTVTFSYKVGGVQGLSSTSGSVTGTVTAGSYGSLQVFPIQVSTAVTEGVHAGPGGSFSTVASDAGLTPGNPSFTNFGAMVTPSGSNAGLATFSVNSLGGYSGLVSLCMGFRYSHSSQTFDLVHCSASFTWPSSGGGGGGGGGSTFVAATTGTILTHNNPSVVGTGAILEITPAVWAGRSPSLQYSWFYKPSCTVGNQFFSFALTSGGAPVSGLTFTVPATIYVDADNQSPFNYTSALSTDGIALMGTTNWSSGSEYGGSGGRIFGVGSGFCSSGSLGAPRSASSAPKYAGPEFSSFGAPVLAGDKLVSQGKRLDGITSLKINGAAATYKVNSASELEIDVPKDLAPGKYDIEITSTHGKLTHLQAFTVKAVVPTKTLEFKGDGRTFGYEELLELTKMAKQIGAEYTSVKCIVNAADASVAQRLVARGCDYVGAIRLRGKEISTEAKSTYKGDGFWFKIVANG